MHFVLFNLWLVKVTKCFALRTTSKTNNGKPHRSPEGFLKHLLSLNSWKFPVSHPGITIQKRLGTLWQTQHGCLSIWFWPLTTLKYRVRFNQCSWRSKLSCFLLYMCIHVVSTSVIKSAMTFMACSSALIHILWLFINFEVWNRLIKFLNLRRKIKKPCILSITRDKLLTVLFTVNGPVFWLELIR